MTAHPPPHLPQAVPPQSSQPTINQPTINQPTTSQLLANIDNRLAVLTATVDQIEAGRRPVQRMTVVDVNMTFMSMVAFMVKWAIASIPAIIILAILGFALSLFATILIGLFAMSL